MSDAVARRLRRGWRPQLLVLADARWLVLAGVLLLLWGAVDSSRLGQDSALVRWSLTHWSFTYRYGFVKRGLPAEVLSWFVEPAFTFPVVLQIALVNSILVGLAFAATVWRPFMNKPERGLLVFALVATTHFGTVQHFFYDTGRFDHFGVLLSILCLSLIGKWPGRVVAVVVALLCSLGVVIHEGFALAFMPMVFMYWAYKTSGRLAAGWRLLGAIIPIAVECLVVLNAGPSIGQHVYLSVLRAEYGEWIHEGSLSVLYANTASNVWRSLQAIISSRWLVHHLILAVCATPSFVLVAGGLRTFAARRDGQPSRENMWQGALLLVATSPLCLYVIGVDFARWWALAITNVFVMLALMMLEFEASSSAFAKVWGASRGLLASVLVVNFAVGPLGVAACAFPRLEPLVDAVVRFLRA